MVVVQMHQDEVAGLDIFELPLQHFNEFIFLLTHIFGPRNN